MKLGDRCLLPILAVVVSRFPKLERAGFGRQVNRESGNKVIGD
jgi:hypothetical protein